MFYSDLEKVANLEATPSVTISLTTHRTLPDNKKDPIELKNLIAEAENKLLTSYDKREIASVMENLRSLEAEVRHEKNLETLVLFASPDFKDSVALPIDVERNTITIDDKFSIRDLLRAIEQTEHYYVLTLSSKEVRLLEYNNETFVHEVKDENFPYVNKDLIATTDVEKSNAPLQDNYLKEFFNRADILFKPYYAETPLPVVLAGVERNVEFYLKVTDNVCRVAGRIHGNFDNRDGVSVHDIGKKAYEVIQGYASDEMQAAMSEISTAEGSNLLVNEITNIYRAAVEGRARKLYVEKNLYQSAVVEGLTVVPVAEAVEVDVVDDIIGEIIYLVTKFDGEVIFVPDGSLGLYQGICLSVRYA